MPLPTKIPNSFLGSFNLPPHKDPSLLKVFLFSLIAHSIVMIIAFGLPAFTLTEPKPFFPTVKVDLVGLPELRPYEVKSTVPITPAIIEEKREQPQKIIKPEPKPEEKVLHLEKPKKETKKDESEKKVVEDERLKKIVDDAEKKQKKRDEEELDKAVVEIAKLKHDEQKVEETLRKGNIISKGTGTSGESGEDIDPYKIYLSETIKSKWSPPLPLRSDLKSRFQIFINPTGEITNLKMLISSGNEQYDKSLEEAIKRSNPVSSPPKSLQRELEDEGVIIDFVPPKE